VLLAYDHLLTISGEIEFVWRRKFSGATVVFLLNRYVTLFGKIMLPISTFWWPNQTDKVCPNDQVRPRNSTANVIQRYIRRLNMLLLFSALRVYAIWNKDWRPLVSVLAIALTIPAMNMVVSIAIHSCAIAADLLVIILTWVKTYEIKKLAGVLRSDTTFSTLLLRDG
ncbi:uncharacterized protein TRAVEDRAFT_103473, partial [Trametes versicolor FP-101664 SS1]|uniref:uncharacterized protein n=1 Tax=Trametes versicolor (strain FP-101664) TaxID=717944 RepID=UPI00046216AA